MDFIALQEHYEGVGVNSVEIITADKVLDSLFYAGEKKPHMWWEEFEKQLTKSFAVYDKKEDRAVYSDEMKLRTLLKKINVDFLKTAKATINLELSRIPMIMTYTHALAMFRNEVNSKFPPNLSSNNQRSCRINKVTTGYSNNDKGKGKKGNNFKGNNKRKSLNGARIIQGMDGNNVEVHPVYNFNPKVWRNIPDAEKDRLRNERQEYKRRQSISAVESIMSQQQMNCQPAPHVYYPPLPPPPPPPQQIALVNARGSGTSNSSSTQRGNSTMIGGRNE